MYLTSSQIEELISENQYTFTGNTNESRCFSGHFENSINLPALALPGGDIGELAVLYSASLAYGFEVNLVESIKVIEDIVGTRKSDTYQHSGLNCAEECRYLHLLSESPEIYSIKKDAVTDLFSTIEQSRIGSKTSSGFKELYRESACVIVDGNVGILPHYIFETYEQKIDARIFIYHKTFVDQRRHKISEALVERKAVKLYKGLSEEYLYEVISEIGDSHVIETINKIDSKIPIYSAVITPSGVIKIENYS